MSYDYDRSVKNQIRVAGLFVVESGEKVNGKYYWDVLLSQKMLPAIRHVVADNFVFQQDISRHTCALGAWQSNSCNVRHLISFLQSYGPNSLNLNPVDYKIWGVIQQFVYEMQIHNVEKLKQRLADVWIGLQISVVDAAVSERRKHL